MNTVFKAPDTSDLRQLTAEEINTLLPGLKNTQDLSMQPYELLWRLELFAFVEETTNNTYIGFGQGEHIHPHDRWLMKKNSSSGNWELNGSDSCSQKVDLKTVSERQKFSAYYFMADTREATDAIASDYIIRLNKLVNIVRVHIRKNLGAENIIITARMYDQFLYLPGTLTSLHKEMITPNDLHSLVCHPEEYKNSHPKKTVIPLDYIKRMNGIEIINEV